MARRNMHIKEHPDKVELHQELCLKVNAGRTWMMVN